MNSFQKAGGIAAMAIAISYIVGFAVYFLILDATDYVGPVRRVAFLIENQSVMYMANLLIYIAASIFLLILVLALHDRLKDTSPATVQVATAFGVIWAGLVIASGMIFSIGVETVIHLYGNNPEQAAMVWFSVGVMQDALGGGSEIVGGLWILPLSWAALRAGKLHRLLNYFGIVIGVAGILSVVPTLEVFTAIFGLSQIGWFFWVGIIMLRSPPSAVVGK